MFDTLTHFMWLYLGTILAIDMFCIIFYFIFTYLKWNENPFKLNNLVNDKLDDITDEQESNK